MLTVDSLRKHFPGIEVLKGITFSLEAGKIYGLVGENGAGKSTLVKILMGIFQPDGGIITVAGEEAYIKNPTQARSDYKIDAVFQEHALIPQMIVAENIALDRIDNFYVQGIISKKALRGNAVKVLEKVDLKIDVNISAGELHEGEKSLIELAKALDRDPDILIFDEMTAPLVSSVVRKMFNIILELKKQGKTLIFISHRLEEVLTICEEIMVLKDGNLEGIINNTKKDNLSKTRRNIIRMMTGTEKGLDFPAKTVSTKNEDAVLTVSNLCNEHLKDINLKIYEGEIVALAGLRSQGQSSLLRTIAGLIHKSQGVVKIFDEPVKIKSPRDAMNRGVFFVTDRRDEEGLWLTHDIWLNISLTTIDERACFGIIPRKKDRKIVKDMVDRLRIATPTVTKIVRQLSGGNRQKVVIGKYLLAHPKILLLDQPTLGLDVGAKVEIYHLLRKLSDEGIPTLAVLTDLEEVVNLPDRLFIMHEGQIVKEFSGKGINEEELLDSYYG